MSDTFIRDATCRYALADAHHLCVDNQGRPLRNDDQQCFYETAEQSRHQAALDRVELELAFIEATGLDHAVEVVDAAVLSLPPCEADGGAEDCCGVGGIHDSFCTSKPRGEPSISEVAEAVGLLLGGCPRCGRPGPAHGPCRAHRSVHCSAEGCW